jgi:hypothetical protein
MFVSISFVVGLAWLLLYSAGYSINWKNASLQPTGAIQVNVIPKRNVTVTVNPGNEVSSDSASSFTHLTPGTYTINVSAQAYQPITLALDVKANSVINLDPLILVPHAEPELADELPQQDDNNESTKALPVTFQSALADLFQGHPLKTYTLPHDKLVVVDTQSQTAMLLQSDGSAISNRTLGNHVISSNQNSAHAVVLVETYGLDVIEPTGNLNTVVRLSEPLVVNHSWMPSGLMEHPTLRTLQATHYTYSTAVQKPIITLRHLHNLSSRLPLYALTRPANQFMYTAEVTITASR